MKWQSLEIFVEHLYKNLGKKRVKRDVTISRGGVRDQIDVQYGLFLKTYVECKDHKKNVPYAEFMRFVGTCNRLGKRGVMVATTDFTPRCYKDASTYGIKLINGKELMKLYRKSGHKPKHPNVRSTVRSHPKKYKPTFKRRAINYSKYGLYCTLALALYENQDKLMPLIEEIKKFIP
ncbi:restriction endonuclease [archaeon]|jgi:hypothetical protein|nr:restriction endonuclease [archaeon]MBT4416527.1 restriction endonuclease [archaeon]